jgi:hypothetical protein
VGDESHSTELHVVSGVWEVTGTHTMNRGSEGDARGRLVGAGYPVTPERAMGPELTFVPTSLMGVAVPAVLLFSLAKFLVPQRPWGPCFCCCQLVILLTSKIILK